ncbi:expressed unknown protein [Seminavis robusta]|uniref:AAA+ ATPase domain-containing protein n=1 Tax=Seminavis robusta TaxID=568900 RepID=A0A9N8HEU0_9STRA|nr:expressed unknown protein [Seminavis robusta]|eukprot:Sro319_g116180.1 n/a (1068) ;mRNA; f:17151-20354
MAPIEAEAPMGMCAVTKDFSLGFQHPLSDTPIKISKPLVPDLSCLHNGQLFGREREIQDLSDAFARGCLPAQSHSSSSSELVLVSGPSGSGKSALVRAALRDLAVQQHGGCYLVGKFDQLQSTPEPYAPFVQALTDWVLSSSSHTDQKDWVQELGSENAAVLQALVPALARVFHLHNADMTFTTAMGREAQQDRLKMALKRFLKAISSETPLVLVLDDCQWSDAGSLALLDSLLSSEQQEPLDNSCNHLLVVAICRSDEVSVHHEFAGMLRTLEDERGTRISHIQVHNLSLQATNQLVSNVLQQPPFMCESLTARIHPKTDGNVFCLFQLLTALLERNVLFPDKEQALWLWDDHKWNQHFPPGEKVNIIDLVTCHIQSLPPRCQRLLQMAAFLGAEFEIDLLRILPWNNDNVEEVEQEQSSSFDTALAETMERGVLQQLPHHPNRGSFTHDQIQLAAYHALVPKKEEQALLHLTIGKTLYQQLSPDDLQERIFLVVNQMIHGAALLQSDSDKNGLANLCLQAGKQSARSSDFRTAIFYFETGIGLLAERCWRDEYHLCLDLYSSLAEATCSTADFEQMDQAIDQVLANATRSTSDTARACTTRIYALSARLKPKAALGLGKVVVAELGVVLPANPGIMSFLGGFIKLKRKLGKKSDKEILASPDIDPHARNHIAAMTILSMMATCTYTADECDLYPSIAFEMVKISLKHGLSAMSSHGFCLFAVVLVAMDDYENAHRYSQLALDIIDRYPHARAEWLPRVSSTVYGLVAPWKKPIATTLAPLLEAHAIGRDSGDIEFSVLAGHFHSLSSYVAGRPLAPIEKSHAAFYNQMVEMKHETWLAMAALLLQFIRTIQGKTANPRVLQFETADETKKASYQAQSLFATICQMILALHYGDFDLALDCSKRSRIAERSLKPSPFLHVYYLYDGLTAVNAARTTKGWARREHIARGRTMAKQLEKLSKVCPENFLCSVYLMKAELLDLRGKVSASMEFYLKAAGQAEKEGYLHVLALANEYNGLAFIRRGGIRRGGLDQGKDLLNQAIAVYKTWGAADIAANKEQIYAEVAAIK